MAEEHRHRGQPRNDQHESQYPPLPGEEEDRARGLPHHPRPAMAAGAVTLPSIQDPSGPYGQPPARVWDSRSASSAYGASPSSANGYPPPGNAGPPQSHANYSPPHQSQYPPPPGHGSSYLPPVQPHPADARGSYPPPPPQGGRMPPSIYATPPQQHHSMMQQQQSPYRDSYGYPYGADRGYPGEYAQGGPGAAGMHPQQAAPRQRTSIACRYCRRRKIRCSGYQNSPGGKCSNCMKMNQECVFQPVSSSASTAFVPVSALQNIPAGTQLYGAYGQPLHGSGAPPYPPPGQYDQPLPSPTGSFGGYPDDRGDASRRRQRPPEEDHAVRLPPPAPFPDDNIRRRSPSSSSSPSHLAPYGPHSTQPPQPGYDGRTPPQPIYDSRTPPQPVYDGRTPPPRGSPSGAAVPPPPPPTAPPTSASGTSNSVMSLGSIMDSNHDIDRGMLGRLNQRKK
ncbi:hypothetical protein G7054_g8878 [Neopestalotiopsis clavispora]|nr:hypothetical protein G7054_g8878 [Neopestalotiopsis clavispora]